jgi:succinyl-diaminopimelate desuccinylase
MSSPTSTPSQPSEQLFEAIAAEVEASQDEIVATLMEAVRIPTQTPPGENYDRMVAHLIPLFGELGFDARRWDVPDDVFEARSRVHYPELEGVRANLLATRSYDGAPPAAFYCHIDTMPAGDRSRWSVEPFEPIVRDGYVWGRGTADSKGGAIAILSAFRVLRRLGLEPAVSPIVALTTDEEIGPYTGVMHMADEGVFDGCRWFYSADGMANSVGVATSGGFTWTIQIAGRSAHSGSSFLGLNPIEHSVPLLEELLATKAEVAKRVSAVRMSPEMIANTGREHVSPVLNVTMARAGVKHNVVPPEFILEGDRRFIAEEDEEQCVAEIEEAIARAEARDPELQCTLTVRPFYTSFANDPDDPWVQHVCRLASAIRGEEMIAAGINGSSDVAHVARVTGIPLAINGLARFSETHNHSPDERCRIDDVLAVTKIVANLLMTPFAE